MELQSAIVLDSYIVFKTRPYANAIGTVVLKWGCVKLTCIHKIHLRDAVEYVELPGTRINFCNGKRGQFYKKLMWIDNPEVSKQFQKRALELVHEEIEKQGVDLSKIIGQIKSESTKQRIPRKSPHAKKEKTSQTAPLHRVLHKGPHGTPRSDRG